MLDLGILAAAAFVAAAVLVVTLKAVGLLIKLLVTVLLLPFHLLGALLALLGGALLLPVLLAVALVVVLGLVAGLVVAPLLPIALLGLLVFGALRLLRPRRA